MRRGSIGSHEQPNEGLTNVWLTPPDLLAALGTFDLDPCAAIGQPWRTGRRQFTERDNGLRQQWSGRVWLNPPYGPHVATWMRKLADHGRGTALLFARTETEAWQRYIWPHCSGVLFLSGRLSFYRADGTPGRTNAGAPSALIAYGAEDWRRLRRSGLAGAYVETVPVAIAA